MMEYIFEERLLEMLLQKGFISQDEHSRAIDLLYKNDQITNPQ